MEESTSFDETFVVNETRFPSFTLCPDYMPYHNKSIECFEDVLEEIENAKKIYKIQYDERRIYKKTKTYNQTLNNDWYFAPKITEYPPYQTEICLIMAPLRNHQLQPDLKIFVSYYSSKNVKILL